MSRRSISRALGRLMPALLALMLLSGCQSGFQAASTPWPLADLSRSGDARLSIFLHLKEAQGPGVRLDIADLEVLSDGVWLPVAAGPLRLDAEAIGSGQLFLGGSAMPLGHYQRLRFSVSESAVRRDDGRYEATVAPPVVEIELPSLVALAQDDSRSLFLVWDVEGSLERGGEVRPSVSITTELRQLLVDLVYAACPDIDTVFVVRSDRNWVADSFGIRGRPTYLAMDPDPTRRRLYVLASGESAVKVVDLVSQRPIDVIHIPLTDVATFMTVSPDGRWAFVLEERSSYLNQIDLETGRSAARLRLSYRPQYARFLADANLLAVSAALTQTVSLHSPGDLTQVATIRTGNSPQGLLVAQGQFYIAESGDHTVSVYDFATNRIQRRLDVGFGPRRLFFNGDQIYVSNFDNGSLSVLLPGQMGVVREIHGLVRPLEMAFNPTYRRLYVGDEGAASLAVVDTTGNQLLGWINLGAPPLGLAVLE